MIRRGRRNGQTMFENILLIIAIVMALAVMFPYVRSAIMGRWKSAADGLGGGLLYNQTGP